MPAPRWLKGNTHTHTNYSDGDSPPEVVVDWYAEHGYDFLFLTDHNVLIPEAHLAQLQRHGLPVWQGEELTTGVVHVNGLGLRREIRPASPYHDAAEPYISESRAERLRAALAAVAAQEGVASVNHPNFRWGLTADDLVAAGEIPLLEVANMAADIQETNRGKTGRPSTEQLWDMLLGAGRRVWGVASDDAHHFERWGPECNNPGRGWLMVDAEARTLDACLASLREGRFYASTGPDLAEYRATGHELVIELSSGPATIELVGSDGRVLDAVDGSGARFDLRHLRSPYARARVLVDGQARLWTQPVFV